MPIHRLSDPILKINLRLPAEKGSGFGNISPRGRHISRIIKTMIAAAQSSNFLYREKLLGSLRKSLRIIQEIIKFVYGIVGFYDI
jgi:hypothetical protein